VPAATPEYAAGVSLWQHRVICRLANAEAARDDVALLVDTKARIQQIVEHEWGTTRRTRSRQVLARWLSQQAGPGVLASAKRAEHALEALTPPTSSQSSRRTVGRPTPLRAVPSPTDLTASVVSSAGAVASGDRGRSASRRLLAARPAFQVAYAQEGIEGGDG
jgi:hypothetical protein